MDEELKRGPAPRIFEKDIHKDTAWVRCPKCRNEYTKLTSSGVCPDCETKINKEKERVKEREDKEYLLDKVNKEINKVKPRADIDG